MLLGESMLIVVKKTDITLEDDGNLTILKSRFIMALKDINAPDKKKKA